MNEMSIESIKKTLTEPKTYRDHLGRDYLIAEPASNVNGKRVGL